MRESGSLGSCNIVLAPKRGQEESWGTPCNETQNKVEQSDGPKRTQQRRALGNFTHADAVRLARTGVRKRVSGATLEGRGGEGRCEQDGRRGEAAAGRGRVPASPSRFSASPGGQGLDRRATSACLALPRCTGAGSYWSHFIISPKPKEASAPQSPAGCS